MEFVNQEFIEGLKLNLHNTRGVKIYHVSEYVCTLDLNVLRYLLI